MTADKQTRIGVAIVGDEILTNRREDKHFRYVVQLLHLRGLQLSWVQYLGDDQNLLARQFRLIRASDEVCFCFGGIGATPDDRTRQAMAEAHDAPLIRHVAAVKEIEEQFGEVAYPNRILMADLPQGADLIPNPYNRIPGFSMGNIHCLPGFPEMAWPMLQWVLDHHYPDLRNEKIIYSAIIVHDVHESDLLSFMEEFQVKHPSIKLSSLPRFLPDGGRQIELGISGKTHAVMKAFAELKKTVSGKGLAYQAMTPNE
ncbi:competence/damage-inducible protein A [Kaarinaea lacus]